MLYLTKCNKAHEVHLLGACPTPLRKIDFKIVSGTILALELDNLPVLPNPVIVFEAFKRSQNLKAQLSFAPERPPRSREALGKKENFSYQKALCILPFMQREHCIK